MASSTLNRNNCIGIISARRAARLKDITAAPEKKSTPAAKKIGDSLRKLCDLDVKMEEHREGGVGGKPIVLSQKRYQQILHKAFERQRLQEDLAKENEQRNSLKRASEELAKKFTGNIKPDPHQKIQIIKQQIEDKAEIARSSLHTSRQNEEEIRRVKLQKAEQLVKKLMPGPRSLQTAALQSEVLRAREIQTNIKIEFEKAVSEQNRLNQEKCTRGGFIFLGEDVQRLEERRKFEDEHKKEILEAIREHECRKRREKEQSLIKARQERMLIDQKVAAERDAEKQMLANKRALLRRNLMEARIMAEQHKKREQMRDEVDDRLCCVYNSGKFELDKMRSAQIDANNAERLRIINRNTERLAEILSKNQTDEDARLKEDIARKESKFCAEEEEKRRKLDEAKCSRIENYLQAVERQKIKKHLDDEIKRFEVAQRFKNSETNTLFEKKQREEQLQKFKETREQLKQQDEERIRLLAEFVGNDLNVQARYLDEDKYFFNYARDLMEHAEKMQRPLYPFARVVDEYKTRNGINLQEKTAKHLQTHISLGRRQPGDSRAAEIAAGKQEKNPLDAVQKEIAQTCEEIDKIMLRQQSKRVEHQNKQDIIECPNELQVTGLPLIYPKTCEEIEKFLGCPTGNIVKKDPCCPAASESKFSVTKKKTGSARRSPKKKVKKPAPGYDDLKNMNSMSAPSLHLCS